MNNPVLFTSLIKDPELLKALAKMKFVNSTPVQASAIPPMLDGKDITVQAPTGTGKTCAFGLPLLHNIDPKDKTIQTLILSPTRELAVQIADVLKQIATFKPGIRITTIYGGESIEKQFAQLRRRPQVVVATPGRLMDHMDRNTIKLDNLNLLVLDEADRMLDMGFRPDLNRILKTVPKERQTALFSATISKEIQNIAKNYQNEPETIKIEQGALTVDTVDQFYTIVKRNAKSDELIALFRDKHPKRSIVFTNTKRMSEQIVFKLKKEGYHAAYLHGDLRQGQRNRVMSQYKTGRIDVLVATDVAARGIDISDVDMVINYDLPREEDSYVHRIGRTGRAHKDGVAYTLIYKGELQAIKTLMRSTKANIQPTVALTGIDDTPDFSDTLGDKTRPRRSKEYGAHNRKPRAKSGGYAGKKPAYGKKRTSSGEESAYGDKKINSKKHSASDGSSTYHKKQSKAGNYRKARPTNKTARPSEN